MEILEVAAKRSKLTLVVDENTFALKAPLRALGFKVLSYKAGTPDEELWELLEGDAIITANPSDFTVSAVIYDFDVIDLSHMKFIDTDQSQENRSAKMIAKAIRESQFYTKRGTWCLKVRDSDFSLQELV